MLWPPPARLGRGCHCVFIIVPLVARRKPRRITESICPNEDCVSGMTHGQREKNQDVYGQLRGPDCGDTFELSINTLLIAKWVGASERELRRQTRSARQHISHGVILDRFIGWQRQLMRTGHRRPLGEGAPRSAAAVAWPRPTSRRQQFRRVPVSASIEIDTHCTITSSGCD